MYDLVVWYESSQLMLGCSCLNIVFACVSIPRGISVKCAALCIFLVYVRVAGKSSAGTVW